MLHQGPYNTDIALILTFYVNHYTTVEPRNGTAFAMHNHPWGNSAVTQPPEFLHTTNPGRIHPEISQNQVIFN